MKTLNVFLKTAKNCKKINNQMDNNKNKLIEYNKYITFIYIINYINVLFLNNM